jgi:phospholipid transport system substrate-binding protein
MNYLGYAFLFFLCAGGGLCAESCDPAEPNSLALDKWDITIKDPNNPDETVQAKWNSVVNVLSDKQLDPTTKAVIIDKLIDPAFDFQLMGKLSLGRTNWPKLNPVQRERFITLFVERLKKSYRDKIMMYDNQQAIFTPAVYIKDAAQVAMQLTSGEKKIGLLYKLRKTEPGWKVYDVEIDGVSVLLTYRSQFDDVLRSGGVDELLALLEKPEQDTPSPKPAL